MTIFVIICVLLAIVSIPSAADREIAYARMKWLDELDEKLKSRIPPTDRRS